MEQEHDWENLTEDSEDAQWIWQHIVSALEKAGRTDVLQKLTVLDLGGRTGEFSKNLTEQGITSVSLDKQNVDTNTGANQVRANAYEMPFPDESFDIVTSNSQFDDIYHLDYSLLLPEVARVLKAKGVLSVCFPSPLPKGELEKLFNLVVSEGKDDLTLWEKK
jgi:ubiquinone/menaquinone biosynthesis C-methylase UbiE